MSGHSKWHQIRRKKAVTDTRRGKMFTQIIKEITIASRMGGGNPDGNPRLRLAIEKAKAGNMPADNIKRAIMKGTGELPGMAYEDVTYEAYGPGGVALIIECVTDNKTRTVSEIRHILDRNHGKLAQAGAVAYQFQRKGIVSIPKSEMSEDDLLALALEAGADDLKSDEDTYTVYTSSDRFDEVRKAVDARNIKIDHSELQQIPDTAVKAEGKDAELVMKLMEVLEEHDDVQHVFSNFDIDEKLMASFSQ
ncbi:MAG: YebC/PmpR family DNA-binding transcriptional regulator [Ignavibacteriales bacterium]|nr:YebC/PmpR family DNA-binding transcriptional regulator [Ignavibacteriales bacterium]